MMRNLTCQHYQPRQGKKHCQHYQPGGDCSRTESKCTEWLKINRSAEMDLFGNPLPEPKKTKHTQAEHAQTECTARLQQPATKVMTDSAMTPAVEFRGLTEQGRLLLERFIKSELQHSSA